MVIDAWDPIVGGAQIHVKELIRELTEAYNVEIDLFVRDLPFDSNQERVTDLNIESDNVRIFKCGPKANFFSFWGRFWSIYSMKKKIQEMHKQSPYDLIHGHSTLSLLPSKKAAKFCKVPVIATIHGTPNVDYDKKNVRYYLERFIFTFLKYDHCISVTHSALKNIGSRSKSVIPNGVSITNAADQVKNDIFTFLYAGRLETVKGIDVLLNAMDQLQKKSDDQFQLYILGSGSMSDQLADIIQQYNLQDRVKLLPQKTHSKTMLEMRKSHAVVIPSRAEGLPLVLLEAWANKVPIIATRVGDMPVVVNASNGILVEKENPTALAAALQKMLHMDKVHREAMGESGYAKVTDTFSWKNIANETIKIYRDVT
jgi:glycosyltransferase involved in cell wall biosynthesis